MRLILFLALASRAAPAPAHACAGFLWPRVRAGAAGHYAYIFPFHATEITVVRGEPFVTVYRGLQGEYSPGRRSRIFERWMFTTLDPEVALKYVAPVGFKSLRAMSIVRLRLPLNLAHVAKRGKTAFGLRNERDEYVPVVNNRGYLWLRWRAPLRRRERELCWDLDQIGDLDTPDYDVKIISTVINPPGGDYLFSHVDWPAARARLRRAIAAGQWTAPAPLTPLPDR